jgi:hypothetical protein
MDGQQPAATTDAPEGPPSRAIAGVGPGQGTHRLTPAPLLVLRVTEAVFFRERMVQAAADDPGR